MRDLVLFRAKRYLGHSPGGGAMVLALLLLLTATVVTGLIVYGGDQKAGPIAAMFTKDTGEAMEEVHEVIANITLAFTLGSYRRGGFGELCASREPGSRHDHGLQAPIGQMRAARRQSLSLRPRLGILRQSALP